MENIKIFAPEASDTLTYTGNSIILYQKRKETVIQLSQVVSFEVTESPNGKKAGRITIKTASTPDAFVKVTSFLTVGGGSEIVFYFDPVCNERAIQIRGLIASGNNTNAQAFSPADEIRKFKGLLDDGIITQEEFNVKKKQLLGL